MNPSHSLDRSRRRGIAGLALGLAIAAGACSEPVQRDELPLRLGALETPNLVLVVVDTLRADWTGPYGADGDITPELSRWAARGVVFERVRAQSSWTKISMASLMTSLWPRSHGIREAQDGLAERAVTLAERLREAGYATYGVQTNGWLDQSFGFHQGFDRYVFPRGGGSGSLTKASVWPHADNVIREAQRLLQAHPPARPFLLYLHFMDVHEFAAPPPFQRFGADTAGAYRAAIHWVDDALRRVRKALEDEGLLDRSILIFASDHGEAFGEHGVHGHARNVLTPVVNVPLVLRLPFAVQPIRVPSQVRNLDLAPTLLELAGLSIPPSFEGESLVDLVTGAEPPRDRESFAGLGVPLFPDASVQSALHAAEWTYARNASAPPDDPEAYEARARASGAELLFDRRVDPGENVNLIEREPGAAARMRARMDRYLARESAGVVEEEVRIDPAIAERLRALGYLR